MDKNGKPQDNEQLKNLQTPLHSTRSLLIWVIIGGIILVFGLLLGMFISKTNLNKQALMTPTPTISGTADISKTAPKRFVQLNRIEAYGSRIPIVTTLLDNVGWVPPSAYQWQDYLLIFDNTTKEIKSHNLKSGETKTIDKIRKSGVGFGTLVWPQVIEKSLYFSFVDYLQEYPIYYLNYPPVGQPKILKDKFESASFTVINGMNFLMGGLGDSCYARTDYSVFDPTTKHSWPTFSSFDGCAYGSRLLDFTKDGKAIMGQRDEDKNEPIEGLGAYMGVYRNIYRIDLKTPDQQEMLLSRDSMPQNVKSVTYFKDEEKIALFGKEIYFFDIANKSLEIVSQAPEEGLLILTFQSLENGKLCAIYTNSKETSKVHQTIEIDIASKTIHKRSESCITAPELMYPTNTAPQTLDEQIRLLDLPANYEIKYE